MIRSVILLLALIACASPLAPPDPSFDEDLDKYCNGDPYFCWWLRQQAVAPVPTDSAPSDGCSTDPTLDWCEF